MALILLGYNRNPIGAVICGFHGFVTLTTLMTFEVLFNFGLF